MYPIYRKRIGTTGVSTECFAIIEQKDGRGKPWVAIDAGRITTLKDAELDAKNLFAMYGDGEGHS